MDDNICLMTDSYKFSHWKQYPPGTQTVYSYLESRGGMFDRTVFFGLQYYLKKYLQGVVVTPVKVMEAKTFVHQHLGQDTFNTEGWLYIANELGGNLPVEICAVPEGYKPQTNNVLMTIRNTDPRCFWLPNYLETLLLKVWYPTTIATLSYNLKEILEEFAGICGYDSDIVNFQMHDFGYRGVSSEESAGLGAAAHLLNFKGTDTVAGIRMLQEYYCCDYMPAFSVPAMEHSTVTSWGQDRELDAYENAMDSYPTGILSIVADSYDIVNACLNIFGKKLKDKILERDGKIVIRPDSDDTIPTLIKVFNILFDKFGYMENSRGYKVLPPVLGVLQGDGIDYHIIRQILNAMVVNGISTENIVFGSGGALLQKVNRDTLKFAFKASAIQIDGKWNGVFKTSPGKESKKGILSLIRDRNVYRTMCYGEPTMSFGNKLRKVFENGEMYKTFTYEDIKNNVERWDC